MYLDNLMTPEEYRRQKRLLEDRIQALVVPGVDAVEEAGKLLERLPELWEEADLKERRKILVTMLDGVYVDTVEEKSVVALKPKPAFQALFQIATTREGSGVVLYKENPPDQFPSPEDDSPCFWWRRGRPHPRFPYIPNRIYFTPLKPSTAPTPSPGRRRWRNDHLTSFLSPPSNLAKRHSVELLPLST